MSIKLPEPVENYIYNNTCLYKNQNQIDLDVDAICEELYKCAGDREAFDSIMDKLEANVMSSDVERKPKNAEHAQQKQIFEQYNTNFSFRTTLPEGELMQEPIFQTNVLHKKYTDTNANSKYYYPTSDISILGEQNAFKTQWTNRANKIILDSQTNRNNRFMRNQVPSMNTMSNFNSNPTQEIPGFGYQTVKMGETLPANAISSIRTFDK